MPLVMQGVFPGVMMYVFLEDGLALLDCCDGIDRIDDHMAPSAFTMELFCYLICDHRIHHVPLRDKVLAFPVCHN